MSGKTTTIDEEQDNEGGNIELKKKLKQLAEEVRTFEEKKINANLIEKVPKKVEKRSLYSAFTNQPVTDSVTKLEVEKKQRQRQPFVIKELSIDTVMFLKFLYENGYFKDAKFARVNERFDIGWFENHYALGYAKFAAIKFARDNRDIAK
jgi:5'-3' exonuclease